MSNPEGLAIARERIAREREEKTGSLDLGHLGLTELPEELFELTQLRRLGLGHGMLDEENKWQSASGNFSPNNIGTQLATLTALKNLNKLSIYGIALATLDGCAGLSELQNLDCSGTQIRDLSPLSVLSGLQTLHCSRTQISDLSPLSVLSGLQNLNCSNTQISDLSPLSVLSGLQTLHCYGTPVRDLSPLAGLSGLQTLYFFATEVSDLSPLAGLSGLQKLDCFETPVRDLSPLAGLSGLQTLDCSATQVSDLSPVAGLSGLQKLDCFDTPVRDLSPLAGLSGLQTLSCDNTQVSDLSPLAGLSGLQTLSCDNTQVSDLSPLAGLSGLENLSCANTLVSDLSPLAGLGGLQSLDCAGTPVRDLTPLAGLSGLQSVDCSDTQVRDLTPLAGLIGLQSVDCSDTPVRDLTPLAGLSGLQSVDCSGTLISDLASLSGLSGLERLQLSRCRLELIPEAFWQKSSLLSLCLFDAHLPGLPAEVLSQSEYENCLHGLRAHLRDLAAGTVDLNDAKLMVLGNGRVGKTQVCRRLRNENFDANVRSTHGVTVTVAPLPSEDSDSTTLHIWDFGGQDIYHGTHALFLRSNALFLIAWTPKAEAESEHAWEGMTFRNHPLPYWIDSVRQFGGAGSPMLIVQTQCDRLEDEMRPLPVPAEMLAGLPAHWELHYSARLNRRRAALDEALREAVERLRERDGVASVGKGRLAVKRHLEGWRDEDASRPPQERRHRTVTQAEFRQICNEAGGISSTEHLLSFLHNAGVVFYQSGLFDDRLILDQQWALEAIYAVFDRETCYRQLQYLRGHFTRPLLEVLVWRDYRIAEQEVFLSMMVSCGVCFVHRRWRQNDVEYVEYIAPDLLPERRDIQVELDARWDADAPIETAEFDYPLLHPGIVRAIISRIGSEAGLAALYWRGGLCVYEATTHSQALIEQEITGPWSGRICVQTQDGQAAELLRRLSSLIEEQNGRMGARATGHGLAGRAAIRPDLPSVPDGEGEKRPELRFDQAPRNEPEYFVSYAWGDDTPEGKAREAHVEQLCTEADKRGIAILRDKNVMQTGDSITQFMDRLSSGDLVYVILSDKYLRSPFCMYELLEIWRKCRGEQDTFLQRVRAFIIPGTPIFDLASRAQYAIHWKTEFEKIDKLIREHGGNVVGERGLKEYRLMQHFHLHVATILELVADRLQPASIDKLVQL